MSFYDSEHHVDFWPKTGGIKNLIIEVQEPVAVYLLKESWRHFLCFVPYDYMSPP